MSRAGRPSQRKDVLVKAPPGIWPEPAPVKTADELTPEDVIQMQAVDIVRLRENLKVQEFSAETIARFAICMIYMFQQHTGEDVVRIPAELFERMKDVEIQIAQPIEANGDVFGRYVERYEGTVILPQGAVQ